MKTIAMIRNGIVSNIAVWDGESAWNPGDEYTLVDITDRPEVHIGHSYDGQDFSAQAEGA